MNTKQLYLRCILLLMVWSLAACDFGNTNVDPTRPTDVPIEVILPSALAQSARNAGSIGARVTGTVIQHFTGTALQTEAYTNYVIDENSIDDFWRTGLYGGAMKDCYIIIQKATQQDLPHYRGIAKVLMAYNLGIATTFWGDVPYSEAFAGNQNLKAAYDTQEEVYASIQRLLDEALADFARDAGSLSPSAKDDLIFDGTIARWAATARALKARYYLHLTGVDPNAATQALQELAKGVISSNAMQPDFPFENTVNGANPLAFFSDDRRNQMQLGTFLSTFMQTLNDPRRSPYGFSLNNFWTRFDTPLPLISYAEVEFIRAEAYLRSGDEPKALTALSRGISANMDKMGITSYATYLTNNASFTGLITFEEKLRRIIEQKYIAMYGHSVIESWVDYRRTGYPVLTPVANANSSFFSAGVTSIPVRYLYPQSERSTNFENYQEAIDRQEGHLLDNPMWAFPQQ
jgi:hypothetical protein